MIILAFFAGWLILSGVFGVLIGKTIALRDVMEPTLDDHAVTLDVDSLV